MNFVKKIICREFCIKRVHNKVSALCVCLRCSEITRAPSSSSSSSSLRRSRAPSLASLTSRKHHNFPPPRTLLSSVWPLTYDAERLLACRQSCCVAIKVKLCVPQLRSSHFFFYSLESDDFTAAFDSGFHGAESLLLLSNREFCSNF